MWFQTFLSTLLILGTVFSERCGCWGDCSKYRIEGIALLPPSVLDGIIWHQLGWILWVSLLLPGHLGSSQATWENYVFSPNSQLVIPSLRHWPVPWCLGAAWTTHGTISLQTSLLGIRAMLWYSLVRKESSLIHNFNVHSKVESWGGGWKTLSRRSNQSSDNIGHENHPGSWGTKQRHLIAS